MQKIVKHFAMAVATLIGLGTAGAASANPTIIINDSNGGLVSYDTTTKVSTVLGNTGTVMYDIAFNNGGDLFGVDGGTLFKLSTTGGATTVLGSMGVRSSTAWSSARTARCTGRATIICTSSTPAMGRPA